MYLILYNAISKLVQVPRHELLHTRFFKVHYIMNCLKLYLNTSAVAPLARNSQHKMEIFNSNVANFHGRTAWGAINLLWVISQQNISPQKTTCLCCYFVECATLKLYKIVYVCGSWFTQSWQKKSSYLINLSPAIKVRWQEKWQCSLLTVDLKACLG